MARNFIASVSLPAITKLREFKHFLKNRRIDHSEVFTEIHHENHWQSPVTLSGPGSELAETEDIRTLLPQWIERLNVQTLLDAPCGDFFWMQHVNLKQCKYIGVEVVPELVDRNQSCFGSDSRQFILADLTRDKLPKADLILCRDCLIHMSFRDARAIIENLKRSNARYLAVTTDTSVTANYPIKTGEYHQINIELPPFSMGKPIELHRDRRNVLPGEKLIDANKALALYRLN